MSADAITLEGIVVETHRGGMHVVRVDLNGQELRVLARCSGKLITRKIRVLPGDKVTVELSPYDPSRGRIIERERVTPVASQ